MRRPDRPIHNEAELNERLKAFDDWDHTLCEMLLSGLDRTRKELQLGAKMAEEMVAKLEKVSRDAERLAEENSRLKAELERSRGMTKLSELENALRERDLLFEHAYGRIDWDDGCDEVAELAERLEEGLSRGR